MKKYITFSSIVLVSVLILSLFTFSSKEHADNLSILENLKEKYSIFALPKPVNNLYFANERAPIENPDIWERYDKELLKNTYWQSNTLLLHKRAAKYFPIIEPILKENNIPDDFKYLALIESGLENVTSPAGAKGFWQIMKSTATEFGLEVNSEIDERYHLEKSTLAACDFLSSAKKKFGSWTLAAAAYNMGRSGLQKQLDRQKCEGYYNLLLNDETSRYVFRILAIKEIIENPKKYGFQFRNEDLYKNIPTYTVKVDSSVGSWADFSNNLGLNYKILKIHNPWLRQSYLTNASRKVYDIKIPLSGAYNLNNQKTSSESNPLDE
ncbi:MAG: lytic transglycosylase domain-containing protein [Flavobacteriales bacterium]|nr:lytic transglycosylase domain-containing protein [Flavobacteriales bacterium]MBL6872793.1 lytic transglycosylase domain-containing protein [Flavobacteriales bacterium]